MASGANITISGGTTMRQVVAGTDLVEAVDFNNARTNVNTLLGTANAVTLGTFTLTNTYGYGQGGAGVGAASAGSNVLATGVNGAFKDLQDDVQALCAFLGQTLRTGVGTDVTTSDTILAATWNNLMLNIQDCWDNRFSPASRTASTDGSVTRVTAWTNTLTQETTWTFASAAACREFFNGGGAVGISASRTGGTASAQNTQWSNALSALSDVWLYYDTTAAGAGSISGVGFYELTTSYQQLVQYFGGASPYTSDYIQVNARVNSTTSPTIVYIQTILVDADDNVIDDSADGTLTINARRNQPNANGSGFSFATPTGSAGAISGS
jgi:hypothetical protein